ncbi:MAG TPA: class I SAM-dependent methyltransferase [Chloroflexota bacterium]|nr:class I SAM-dependent methyltransferase [Chloroflexota bacterium]
MHAAMGSYGSPGFAEQYDASRPRTPEVLAELLCQYARVARPRLVVDLGCGTGLSTAVWVERAAAVVGVEQEPAMLALARRRLDAPHVRLQQGSAQDTGVASGAAEVVTCVQAFHWMEPHTTLAEVARILRPGGVFAAVDYEMPAVDWEVEQADLHFISTARRLLREHHLAGLEEGQGRFWPKEGHLESLRQSGHFGYVREVFLHGVEPCGAARLVQTAMELVGAPWGALEALYARGVTDEQLGLAAFRAVAARRLGAGARCLVGYRVRLGIKA